MMNFIRQKGLADLPCDILIGMRIKDMGIWQPGIYGTDYLIENYPYKGQTIPVTVKSNIPWGNDFYTPVPEFHENNTNYGLCVGRDGRYYSESHSISYAFQYYWQNDIEGLIREIDNIYNNRIALMEPVRSFNIFELGELAYQDKNRIVLLNYMFYCDCLEQRYQEGELSKAEYEKNLRELEQGPEYEKYLYFRDKFKIICHFAFLPKEVRYRNLPMLMVDRNRDGTWLIHVALTAEKYPGFDELLYGAITDRSAERERFTLIVDVDGIFSSEKDIEHAVCGFRIRENSVDVYDAYEGAQLFGKASREAYQSGKYVIKGDFIG